MLKKIFAFSLWFFSSCVMAKSYETEHFTIEYDDNVPKSAVEQLAKRVKDNREVVLAYLKQTGEYTGTPIKEPLVVYISKQRRTPYQNWNTIHIPEQRVLNTFLENDQEHAGMAVIHELTHVYAVSAYRKNKKNGYEDRFYDDGLAVFMQHRFGESPGYPDFGKDLYRAVLEKSIEYGELIPLKKTEEVRHSARTGLGRQLAYLQEGAFTQFLIENYGLDAYWKLYKGQQPKDVTGKSFAQLEREWSALMNSFKT